MPSPMSTPSNAPPVQSQDPLHQENTIGAQEAQNGAPGDEDVQSSDPAAGGTNAEGNDIIREGKAKAKAMMAASGVETSSNSGQNASPGRSRTPPGSHDAANGPSPSRKRSRSGSRIPSQAPSQGSSSQNQASLTEYLIGQYTTRDMLHSAAMSEQANRDAKVMSEKLAELEYYKNLRQQRHMDPGSVFGYGFEGYGNGITDSKQPHVLYPQFRKRLGKRRAKNFYAPKKDLQKQAEQFEELVPVRLDIEFEKIKLRDTFTWNLHDRLVTPSLFAENMVEDFKIPNELIDSVMRHIDGEIKEQLQDYYPHVFFKEDPLDPHLPYDAYKNDEMRILIKLNVTIGAHTLVDQFEWDVNDPMNSPEEFARCMTSELSLSGEFTTAIAHSIREQCQMFTKSLYITGHPFDGRPVEDADVRDSFLPSPLPSVFRPVQAAKDYAPVLYELNEADLERAELSIMREQRRQKRSVNRRGGPALPDLKDRQRTVRTMVVSSVIPGAAEVAEESRLYKMSRSGGRSRRAVRDGADDSDESESEESGVESPAPSQITGGTARTRGMRGAATAATVAMRANLGRSQTPELSQIQHHHETRTSRRLGGDREESVAESTTHILKLRIPREKYRRWMAAQTNGRASEYRTALNPLVASAASTPQHVTPSRNSMPPPPSPAMQQRSTPVPGTPTTTASSNGQQQQQVRYYPDGRADAPYPQPAHPPPPAKWLSDAVQQLHEKDPRTAVEALMRYAAIDTTTNAQVRLDNLPPPEKPGQLPPNVKFMWLPRIKCLDCPGKLYTAGPGLTVDNFAVHLKNRVHIDAVKKRNGQPVSRGTSASASAS